MERNYIVVKSESLSDLYESRYVVVDKGTGVILDDAQGYGYKTIKNAYSAYSYKKRDKSKDKQKKEKRLQIKAWMKDHPTFIHLMDGIAIDMAKGSWDPNEKMDSAFVKQLLKDNNLEIDFTPRELLSVWRNGV